MINGGAVGSEWGSQGKARSVRAASQWLLSTRGLQRPVGRTACGSDFCIVDTATLTDNQTGPLTASASSVIVHPDVHIAKTASATALVPGNTFTYGISVVNAGYGIAQNVTVSDTHTARRSFKPARKSRDGPASARGWPMASAPKPKTCPRSS